MACNSARTRWYTPPERLGVLLFSHASFVIDLFLYQSADIAQSDKGLSTVYP